MARRGSVSPAEHRCATRWKRVGLHIPLACEIRLGVVFCHWILQIFSASSSRGSNRRNNTLTPSERSEDDGEVCENLADSFLSLSMFYFHITTYSNVEYLCDDKDIVYSTTLTTASQILFTLPDVLISLKADEYIFKLWVISLGYLNVL